MHSPLPWKVRVGRDGSSVWDATETPILLADTAFVPEAEALANAVFVARACAAHPALLSVLGAASLALRSYQAGNSAPGLAKDVADACDAAIAQAEGR